MALLLPVLDNRSDNYHFFLLWWILFRKCSFGAFYCWKLYLNVFILAFYDLQVITGYLLAGSVIGPGGLSFVSEMVQVCCHLSYHAWYVTYACILMVFWFLLVMDPFVISLHKLLFSYPSCHKNISEFDLIVVLIKLRIDMFFFLFCILTISTHVTSVVLNVIMHEGWDSCSVWCYLSSFCIGPGVFRYEG